jgi:phosphoribosylamine--glycine ligase
MRILVVGSGGREHALAWRLVRDGAEVIVAPGSDGIATTTECAAIDARDHGGIVELARTRRVDAVLVGPEQPLVDGLADRARAAGLAVFGPGAAGAALEGSKAFAKGFMERHGVPTARARVVTAVAQLDAALAAFDTPPVVKADGLAAGKGVTVAQTWDEAKDAALACLDRRAFGDAGARVVLEQRLVGEEASLFVVTDGNAAVWLPAAQDHKRIGDGDTGPNTGGMGAYAPAPVFSAAVRERVAKSIVAPTIAGLRSDGVPFRGVVFVGLMIDEGGMPHVIEYNCRFGDPEIQALCLGTRAPLGEVIVAAARGELRDGELAMSPAATVVMAAAGYPGTPRTGDAITGLDVASRLPGVQVFHAGTRRVGDGFVTHGGRVLGVAAAADTLRAAVDRAYEAVRCISFAGAQVRSDVGARAFA